MLRGEVRDVKPPACTSPTIPTLTVHHMVIELAGHRARPRDRGGVGAHGDPSATDVPQRDGRRTSRSSACRSRAGSTPRCASCSAGRFGCTHTTALLAGDEGAGTVIQSAWSLNMANRTGDDGPPGFDEAARASVVRSSLNTCHIWAEGSRAPPRDPRRRHALRLARCRCRVRSRRARPRRPEPGPRIGQGARVRATSASTVERVPGTTSSFDEPHG